MGKIVTLAAIAALVAAPVRASGMDLSPGHWPEAERLRIEAREAMIWPDEVRSAGGNGGVVSGTASPVAVHAGAEVLRRGGTAADAAVATALAQVTMMAGANVSFAGVAELLYFDARTRRVHVLDAGWNGWRGETSPATIPAADISMITGKAPATAGAAGRKTLVPGFMAGMEAMHARFGRLAWGELFAPAIWYAEQGVPVTPLLAAYFNVARPVMEGTPEGRAFVFDSDGRVRRAGERFVVPGLGTTLRAVARDGARVMYRGDWARRYVAAVRANGGAASLTDMAAYKVRWNQPLTMDYAGGTLAAPDASNVSGCAMLMALNLIGHAGTGRRYWQEADAFRTSALSLRVAISAPYAPEVAALDARLGMGSGCAVHAREAWGAAAVGALAELGETRAAAPEGHHSASVVAVDRWGNVAALVHSSNTPLWGDSAMVVGGIPVPVPAGIYQLRLAAIAAGGRLPSGMAPLMLLRGGRPVAAIAAIGSSVVPETVRLMVGLAGEEAMAEWIGAPPLLLNFEQFELPLARRDELIPAGRYSRTLLDAVRSKGLPLRDTDPQRVLTLRGVPAAVRFVQGRREAVEVPGVMGFAEAE